MKAKLLPLKHKYYGTSIEIRDGDKKVTLCDFVVRGSTNIRPSDRELESVGATIEDYKNSDDFYYEYGIDGSHYETQATYETAQKIVNAINNYERD